MNFLIENKKRTFCNRVCAVSLFSINFNKPLTYLWYFKGIRKIFQITNKTILKITGQSFLVVKTKVGRAL